LDNGVIIEGRTNLPDGTKLGVEVPVRDGREAQDFVFVKSGTFRSAAFSNGGKPIPGGKRKVHIFTWFNVHWQTSAILELIGKGGSKLRLSGVIVSEDPQLMDAEKQLEFSEALIIPPLVNPPAKRTSNASATGLSAEETAISLVKNARLVVDGDKSSETVEGGVMHYFKSPVMSPGDGIRMGQGWSAEPKSEKSDRVYEVRLDFINGKAGSTQAIWEADLETKKVLYRNKYAKYFSWIPNY
jgi:hypothetical protein